MKKTFEHLLGLNARDALAILKSAGIFDVRVTFTSAPAPLKRGEADCGPRETSMLRAVANTFSVTDREAEPPPDPLLEPVLDDGMLTEARVVGVRDDGRQLIVSRFRLSPKDGKHNEE